MTTRHTPPQIKKVALYARFSSDLQKDRSIEDQFSELERAAKRLGLQTDKRFYFADRGVSASSLFDRPGLTRDLIGAAQRREFDAVLVEATDRLSRDRADLFWLAKRFTFHNITLFTPTGEVSDMQLTFDGHSNEDFIRKLAVRVKRGHDSITREGKIAGSKCYGYDLVPGKPGERKINEAEAAIVRRIFTEYAGGLTPRKIVQGLRRDGVVSPTGKAVWNWQGILGSAKAATGSGILHRDLYRGKIVRNRTNHVKNPDNGRRVIRLANPEDVIVVDAPALRIVSDELWNAVHAVRQKRSAQMNPSGVVTMTLGVPRKHHLLAGIVKCATCAGLMTIASSSRGGQIGCSNARYRGTCDHSKLYDLTTITTEVVDKMDKELTNPEFLKARVRARALELAKAERDEGSERQAVQRQLDRLNVQIARLVDVLADGDLPVAEVKEKIKAKEIERVSLNERMRLLGNSNVTTLPSAVMNTFTKSVESLASLLRETPNDPACRLAFGNVIDTVLVHPTPKKAPYDLSMYARVSAVSNLNLFPEARSHEKIVQQEGVRGLIATVNTVTSD
ncbi:recombinase family protein [Bradyrhizobium sp. LB11.1]|uniref:recombinase family protein n=1 Tax=Bradyrhizobium sp. LB11.1 TaxID=3156326 RepID=UPI0033997D46